MKKCKNHVKTEYSSYLHEVMFQAVSALHQNNRIYPQICGFFERSPTMNMELQDERYQVVNQAIFDALLLLLEEKELAKITVSDIIKKAGIVRSTFYNHYENIPALITAFEDKTIHDIFSMMENFHPENDYELCKSYFKMLCQYTKNNIFLAGLLSSPHEIDFFEKFMTSFHNYVKNVTKNASPMEHSRDDYSYMVAASIGATLGILHKWTRDNCMVSEDHIAEILTNAFMNGMFPFMS